MKRARAFGQDPAMPMAQLGLARVNAAQGDKAKARTFYQDCLGLEER